ncbi:hypothetical protein RHGRI_013735 [Rhododendron griersonianum]|nr:hypothetical protein RHGRI_013735 [Rhododendron griersonianum]
MFNNEQQQQGHCTSIPRISFSSDFADSQQAIKPENSYREPPVSSDFEFSLSNFGMIAADELIVKGKLLPLKELLADEEEDDEYDTVFQRPPKSSGRWKGKLGLKRPQFLPKKAEKGQELYKRYLFKHIEYFSCLFVFSLLKPNIQTRPKIQQELFSM